MRVSRRLGLAALLATVALLLGAAPASAYSTLDAGLVDAFLAEHGSPMTGMGATFIAEGAEHGVDPAFLIAVTGAESSFGLYLYDSQGDQAAYNPFNWFYTAERRDADFASWQDAIAAVAAGISGELYYGSGLYSVDQIGPRYCPEGTANWLANVKLFMTALGGDPADTRYVSAGPPTFDPSLLALDGAVAVKGRGDDPTPYHFGDRVTATFTVTNSGDTPMALDSVTLAVRGPHGAAQDLTTGSLVLGPHESHAFVGSWKLTEHGPWMGWIEVSHAGTRALIGSAKAVQFRTTLSHDVRVRHWMLGQLALGPAD